MAKVTRKGIQLLQNNLEMVLLSFVYDRCIQGRPFMFLGTDENDSLHIEKLKNMYGIHILEETTAPDHREYYIPIGQLELARNTLNNFYNEVFA